MSGSGLIYALIVAVWACVLVPRWVRRPDDEAEGAHDVDGLDVRAGSAGGSAAAIRVVPRRTPAVSERSAPAERADLPAQPPLAGARTRMLARRRRTLLVLLAFTVLATTAAAAGAVPWWPALGPALLLVLYLTRLRSQARAARHARRPAEDAQTASQPVDSQPVDSQPAGGHVQVTSPTPASPAQPAGPEAQSDVRPEAQPYVRPADPDAGPAWDPVHIPPPTYVTAPSAPSPARSIDLSRPGFWAEGWRVASDSVDQGNVEDGREVTGTEDAGHSAPASPAVDNQPGRGDDQRREQRRAVND